MLLVLETMIFLIPAPTRN